MIILVTAGNTFAPIDRVRGITNIFTGRTGTQIALHAAERGHEVTLVTSHPELLAEGAIKSTTHSLKEISYRTFDDLARVMAEEIGARNHDAVIHCAAVSDYLTAGVYAPASGTQFDQASASWTAKDRNPPTLADCTAAKVKSDVPELWLRLVRAPKLVDRIRTDWHFNGILVKFKLEVGIDEPALQDIAERSRQQSKANLIVANTLEGAKSWALIGNQSGYVKVARSELAERLLNAIAQTREVPSRG